MDRMMLLMAICLGRTALGIHFPQGAPVEWENGPLPSETAAWVLVKAEAAQARLPWQLAAGSAATVAVLGKSHSRPLQSAAKTANSHRHA